MSQMANITVFDGAATPVSHTLIPISVSREKDEAVAVYREANASVPAYAQVSATFRLKRMASGVYRANARTEVPVMESVSGQNSAGYTAAPKVAYIDTYDISGFFHERSTITGRRLARQLAVNIAGGITTSVTPVTTGPFAELFDLLVMPT